jgi:hypothetical protein
VAGIGVLLELDGEAETEDVFDAADLRFCRLHSPRDFGTGAAAE